MLNILALTTDESCQSIVHSDAGDMFCWFIDGVLVSVLASSAGGRKVSRYQRNNQKRYIEEEQAIQWTMK